MDNTVEMNGKIILLKLMDNFVRETVEDEETLVGDWLALGVPDCADEEMFEFIATNEESFVSCLESFYRCCLKAEEDYF